MLDEGHKWVELENQKPVHSDNDVKEYSERIDSLSSIMDMLRNRQNNFETINP